MAEECVHVVPKTQPENLPASVVTTAISHHAHRKRSTEANYTPYSLWASAPANG
jgi:hypothetical protein